MDSDGAHHSFLPVAEAAARLGISRVKLREIAAKGLLPARRDNQGRLRVDLTGAPADLPARAAGIAAAPEALMGALFDEIEELSADLEESHALTGRLDGVLAAQGAALDRAVAALEQRTAERDGLAAVAARALSVAEEAEGRATALRAVTDRAMQALDRTTAALETALAETQALRSQAADHQQQITGQLDRLFTLSEKALEAAARVRAAPSLVARVFGRR
jgi:methyl-accepting chemotaxis protein